MYERLYDVDNKGSSTQRKLAQNTTLMTRIGQMTCWNIGRDLDCL